MLKLSTLCNQLRVIKHYVTSCETFMSPVAARKQIKINVFLVLKSIFIGSLYQRGEISYIKIDFVSEITN